MILAILNPHVAQMPSSKFGLYLTGFRSRCSFKSFKMAVHSESLYRSNASHQVSAQSKLRFGRTCRLKNSNMAAMAAIFGYQNGTILVILNPYVAPMPPIKFRLNLTFGLDRDV